MPYSHKLEILRELRERSGLTQSEMAYHCGLRGLKSHQTAGAWERGEIIPNKARRNRFIGYLWDHLRLRDDLPQFDAVWDVLVEIWDWEPISDQEWAEFTRQPRPSAIAFQAEATAQAHVQPPAQSGALPATQTQKIPFQAPTLTPHFVERENELARLCAQIQTPRPETQRTKILAIVGMGGVGKSSLACQVAYALRHHFADGVLWASASTSAALDIIDQWAQEYGCDFGRLSDLQSRAAALRSLLAHKNALLILDNVTTVSQIQPLLPNASGCVVLLTTRSEDVAVALGAEICRLSELSVAGGLALLAALLGSTRVEAELEAAKTICRQLQCLPLALEIVGQLLHVRSQRRVADLSLYLENVNHRLSLQISDRAVRTSFMASWEVLDKAHQQSFAALGVFAGREFSAEAVAQVAQIDLYTAQDHLYTLVALSLVREFGPDRFQQHPLLAGFAYEQLEDAPATELRMAYYYERYLRQHDKRNLAVDGEWESVVAGMQVAYRLQQWSLVLAYGYSFTDLWFRQARYGQARTGYQWMFEAATALEDVAAQAFAQQKWGCACLEQDDYSEAVEHLHLGLQYCEAAQDQVGLAENTYWLARIEVEKGEYGDAQQHLETCHQIFEDFAHAAGLARTYYQQALLAYRAGELDICQRLNEQAAAIQSNLEDQIDHLATLRLLVDVFLERKEYAVADQYCQKALALAESLQLRSELAATHYSMTVVARRLSDLDRAEKYCEQASSLFETMGDKAFFALTLYERSKINGLRQQTATALNWGHQSLAVFQELEDDFNQVYVLYHLGQLYSLDTGDPAPGVASPAFTYWQQAYGIAQRMTHPLVSALQASLATQYSVQGT